MRADSTDLSAFKAHGGKLVIAHGVSDPVFSIIGTINWWNDLNSVNGGRANEFVRVFAVPGMNHCAGGPATDQFDAIRSEIAKRQGASNSAKPDSAGGTILRRLTGATS